MNLENFQSARYEINTIDHDIFHQSPVLEKNINESHISPGECMILHDVKESQASKYNQIVNDDEKLSYFIISREHLSRMYQMKDDT